MFPPPQSFIKNYENYEKLTLEFHLFKTAPAASLHVFTVSSVGFFSVSSSIKLWMGPWGSPPLWSTPCVTTALGKMEAEYLSVLELWHLDQTGARVGCLLRDLILRSIFGLIRRIGLEVWSKGAAWVQESEAKGLEVGFQESIREQEAAGLNREWVWRSPKWCVSEHQQKCWGAQERRQHPKAGCPVFLAPVNPSQDTSQTSN